MRKKLIVSSLLCIPLALASEHSEKIQKSVHKLTTIFEPETIVMKSNASEIIEKDGFNLSINNHWLMNIKSKYFADIKKISLEIDGNTVANNSSIILKPNTSIQYLFGNVDFLNHIKNITKGYINLGIYQHLTANDFTGFNHYYVKKVNLTLDWMDEAKNYNQSNFNFMMVLAK